MSEVDEEGFTIAPENRYTDPHKSDESGWSDEDEEAYVSSRPKLKIKIKEVPDAPVAAVVKPVAAPPQVLAPLAGPAGPKRHRRTNSADASGSGSGVGAAAGGLRRGESAAVLSVSTGGLSGASVSEGEGEHHADGQSNGGGLPPLSIKPAPSAAPASYFQKNRPAPGAAPAPAPPPPEEDEEEDGEDDGELRLRCSLCHTMIKMSLIDQHSKLCVARPKNLPEKVSHADTRKELEATVAELRGKLAAAQQDVEKLRAAAAHARAQREAVVIAEGALFDAKVAFQEERQRWQTERAALLVRMEELEERVRNHGKGGSEATMSNKPPVAESEQLATPPVVAPAEERESDESPPPPAAHASTAAVDGGEKHAAPAAVAGGSGDEGYRTPDESDLL